MGKRQSPALIHLKHIAVVLQCVSEIGRVLMTKKQRNTNAWLADMIQVTTSRLQNILTGCTRVIILCDSCRRHNYLYVDIEEHAIPRLELHQYQYRFPVLSNLRKNFGKKHRFTNNPNRLGRQHATFQPDI